VISLCGGDVNSRIYGGRGNDILWGSQITDDLLVGGPGFDRARGMSGTDTCYTEVARGCELP
jgi:Ca2+-binding RTX toxin-like protein